jgi:hypothetical protein
VRSETNPDDLAGMVAAAGVLTARGDKNSRAAGVARGMGKTAVCGSEALVIDTDGRQMESPDGRTFSEGDVISIDGRPGEVFAGALPVGPSAIVDYFENGIDPAVEGVDVGKAELVRAVDRLVLHADSPSFRGAGQCPYCTGCESWPSNGGSGGWAVSHRTHVSRRSQKPLSGIHNPSPHMTRNVTWTNAGTEPNH